MQKVFTKQGSRQNVETNSLPFPPKKSEPRFDFPDKFVKF